jgi:hypothetical protein
LAGRFVAAAASLAIPVHYVSEDMLTVNPADKTALRVLDHLGPNIFSQESLAALIRKHSLSRRERAHLPLSDVIDTMKSRISVHAVAPGWAGGLTFAVSFAYPDRQVVEQITGELVSLFIEGKLDAAHSHSDSVLGVTPAKGVGPNRAWLLGVGLLVGLFVGLAAAVVRSRRATTACPTCGHRIAVNPTHFPGISGESGNLLSASVGTP